MIFFTANNVFINLLLGLFKLGNKESYGVWIDLGTKSLDFVGIVISEKLFIARLSNHWRSREQF